MTRRWWRKAPEEISIWVCRSGLHVYPDPKWSGRSSHVPGLEVTGSAVVEDDGTRTPTCHGYRTCGDRRCSRVEYVRTQYPTHRRNSMQFKAMIEGLQILAKYEDKGLDAFLGGADHDVVWASYAPIEEGDSDKYGDPILTDPRLSAEDAKRLDDLGWHLDSDSECWAHFC